MKAFDPTPDFHWTLIRMEGEDSEDFLHRLSTADVKGLPTGKGTLACFLTPQGRFQSSFHLWKIQPDKFIFEFDGGPDQTWEKRFFSFIDQFHFGEALSLSREENLKPIWYFSDEDHSEWTSETSKEVLKFFLSRKAFGKNWESHWLPEEEIEQIKKSSSFLRIQDLENWRILSSYPRVDHEITPTVTPLEVGFSESISFDKGCYPGQEVIEKMISIGSPPKRLARVHFNERPRVGDKLFDSNQKTEIGTMTSVAEGHNEGLALIKKTFAEIGKEVQIKNGEMGKIELISPYAPEN